MKPFLHLSIRDHDGAAALETPEGERIPVKTQISGILRGLLRDGYPVPKGFKVADVDPRREELENYLYRATYSILRSAVDELVTFLAEV